MNIMQFCKEYNAATQDKAGMIIPVEITVYEDRSFTFILKTPPASGASWLHAACVSPVGAGVIRRGGGPLLHLHPRDGPSFWIMLHACSTLLSGAAACCQPSRAEVGGAVASCSPAGRPAAQLIFCIAAAPFFSCSAAEEGGGRGERVGRAQPQKGRLVGVGGGPLGMLWLGL